MAGVGAERGLHGPGRAIHEIGAVTSVDVDVHKAGREIAPSGIHHFRTLRHAHLVHRSNGGDPPLSTDHRRVQ